MMYTISYEKNNVYQTIGMDAKTAEQAVSYFAQYKPAAKYIGICEGVENKPGFPVITVPEDFREAPEEPEQTVKTLYVNMSTIKTEITTSAAKALEWHRAGDVVRVDRGYKYTDIPGAQPPTPRDGGNLKHCRYIAQELEAYAAGTVCRCPECGEEIRLPDNVGDKYRCPHCGGVTDVDHLEPLGVLDWLEDALDIEYRVDGRLNYRSAEIMVACGGPNIYIDTASRSVELYWWSERASYPLSRDAADAVDDAIEELWLCR